MKALLPWDSRGTFTEGNRRDALDLAGKLPLAVKALAMGISLGDFNVDPAQAGGLLGKFDAAVGGASGAANEGVEIKGAGSTSGPRTFDSLVNRRQR